MWLAGFITLMCLYLYGYIPGWGFFLICVTFPFLVGWELSNYRRRRPDKPAK